MGLFGKPIPPRKKKVYKAYLPFHFLLTGTVPSKKNEWIPANNFRSLAKRVNKSTSVNDAISWMAERIKGYIRPNNRFIKWEAEAKEKLIEQAAHYAKKYKKYGVIYPLNNCSISVYCYWSSNTAKDNVNKLESIQDILVDCGIITSDCWQNLNPIKVESELYSGEITENIFVITLMLNLDVPLSELSKMENKTIGDDLIIKIPQINEDEGEYEDYNYNDLS